MVLKDKVAIITGGGKGIGRAISRKFLDQGADLVLVARTQEAMEEVAREGAALGRQVLVVVGDASQEEVARRAVERAVAAFGKIDILVNNTGIEGPSAPITEIDLEEWDHGIKVNLNSAFLFCKHVIPIMKKAGQGCVINISSLSGTRGLRGRSNYCASKWGMIGLARAVAEEVGPDNIRVNTVCPGAVAGPRIDRVMEKRAKEFGLSVEEMVAKTLQDTPLRRMVTEEEIAEVACFLASDAASGITGEEIIVSGGRR
ncbi:MAG: SDR family NAD(P)-dependent oxidoreductase [Limnochordia bacterium]